MGNIRAVWQVSGGPQTRSYADLLIRHGVTLMGPGDAGPWRPDRDDREFEGTFIRRFASELQVGDVLLLRTGATKIRGIGLVASDYVYLDAFDDVNGWDLQHARRVRWTEFPEEYDFGVSVFGANPPRLSALANPVVVEFAERFLNSPPLRWQEAPLPGLPAEQPPLDDVPDELRGVVAEVNDLLPLFQHEQSFGEWPTEDELVAHFVVPLLRDLGWRPERIAVKWRRIDVALFSDLPRSPENCCLVMEAKRLGAGVEGALKQALEYVEELGFKRDVVVTDGVRYRMYSARQDYAPVAYANLARLKRPAVELFTRLRRQ